MMLIIVVMLGVMSMINKNFNKKTFALVKKLYWDEGYDYTDISEAIKCNPSSIGRILYGIYSPIESRRNKKKSQYAPNFKASPNEPKQTKILRCKRDTLPSTKLNLNIATNIRKLYFSGEKNQIELANKYQINQSTVCKIITGQNWKICKC